MIFEWVFIALFTLVFITEVVVPAYKDEKFFPHFRKKTAADRMLDGATERVHDAHATLDAATKIDEASKLDAEAQEALRRASDHYNDEFHGRKS